MATDVKPIRTQADHAAAMAEVETLWGASAGSDAADRLDVLATLIDAWEARHLPMDPPDAVEAIRFRMEQQGLTPEDMSDIIGPLARVDAVLNRERDLSIGMIRRLHDRLGISADVLIRRTRARAA